MAHPRLYLLQAGGQLCYTGRGSGARGGGDLDMYLCVVGVTMKGYVVSVDDVSKGKHVYGEEGWAEH